MRLYRVWYLDPSRPQVLWEEIPANDRDEALTRFWEMYEPKGFRVTQVEEDVEAGGPKNQ